MNTCQARGRSPFDESQSLVGMVDEYGSLPSSMPAPMFGSQTALQRAIQNSVEKLEKRVNDAELCLERGMESKLPVADEGQPSMSTMDRGWLKDCIRFSPQDNPHVSLTLQEIAGLADETAVDQPLETPTSLTSLRSQALYDPNLVAPKDGRQFKIGEIQTLRLYLSLYDALEERLTNQAKEYLRVLPELFNSELNLTTKQAKGDLRELQKRNPELFNGKLLEKKLAGNVQDYLRELQHDKSNLFSRYKRYDIERFIMPDLSQLPIICEGETKEQWIKRVQDFKGLNPVHNGMIRRWIMDYKMTDHIWRENPLLEGIDEEIQYFAQEVRDMSKPVDSHKGKTLNIDYLDCKPFEGKKIPYNVRDQKTGTHVFTFTVELNDWLLSDGNIEEDKDLSRLDPNLSHVSDFGDQDYNYYCSFPMGGIQAFREYLLAMENEADPGQTMPPNGIPGPDFARAAQIAKDIGAVMMIRGKAP